LRESPSTVTLDVSEGAHRMSEDDFDDDYEFQAEPTPERTPPPDDGLTPQERRRLKRNARLRRQREAKRLAQGKPKRPSTPFKRGYAILRGSVTGYDEAVETGTDLTVAGEGLRHALSAEQLDAAREVFEAMGRRGNTGFAANTRRAMAADMLHWKAFCAETGHAVLPIDEEGLKRFFDALVDAGYKRGTLEHLLFTFRTVGRFYGCADPLASRSAWAYWRDLCRERLSARSKQATGLLLKHVEAMAQVVDRSNPVDLRDLAMVRVCYDLMTRPSELVSLRWADLTDEDNGEGLILIARSKTDQHGVGHMGYLSQPTMASLRDWQTVCDPRAEPLFHAVRTVGTADWEAKQRAAEEVALPVSFAASAAKGGPPALTVKAVAAAMQRLATRAGLGTVNFSGHSARVGAAQDMVDAGVPLLEVMHQGRWKSTAMPARYAESRNAINAGRVRFSKVRGSLKEGWQG
jgi:integrase